MGIQEKSRFHRFVEWRESKITDRTFTLMLALAIGLLASFAAYVLHSLIHVIQHLLTSDFNMRSFNWLYLVFPIVGIWLTSLFVKYIVKDNISHGITRILYAISTKESRLRKNN